MKKAIVHPLILVTCVFAALLTGFFFGRNFDRDPVQIQPVTAPEAEQQTGTSPAAADLPTIPGRVNINTATAEQLQTLPGIGETYARRIIEYRETNGPFESIGELANIAGIGEKRIEQIWDLVTTGG